MVYVTTVPDDYAAGHVKYENAPRSILRAARDGDHDNPRLIHWIERDLITTLAGGFAQAKFNPNSDWRGGMGEIGGFACWGGSDIQNAIRLVDDLHGEGPVADAYYAYVKARASAFVEYQWPEIQRVAAALLESKTLTADQVRAVVSPEFSKVA